MPEKTEISYLSFEGRTKKAFVDNDNFAVDKNNPIIIQPRFAISADDTLPIIFMRIREVVLSNPPYVQASQIPWMLSILDELSGLAEKDVWPVAPPTEYRANHFLSYHCDGRDIIYKIRFYYMIEFVCSHLYGADLGNFNFGSKIKSFKVYGSLKGAAIEDSPYFVRDVGKFLRSKEFNQQMNYWLEGHRVVVENKSITTSNGKVDDTAFGKLVVGTLGGYINAKAPYGMKAVPASLSKEKSTAEHLEFPFSPMLATYIEIFDDSKAECVRVNAPLDSIIFFSKKPLQQNQRGEGSRVSNAPTLHVEDALAAWEIDNKLREQRQEDLARRAHEMMRRMYNHRF